MVADVGVHGGVPRALRAQDQLDTLADRAAPAPGARDDVRERLDLRGGVGDRDGQPDPLEGRNVDEVVTDERDRLGAEAVLGQERIHALALPRRAQDDRVDAERLAPRFRDPALFVRDQCGPDSGPPGRTNPTPSRE